MPKAKGPAMRKLAQLVSRRLNIPVEADYATEGRGTKWYLQWSNGPTVETMRRHAKAAARGVPDVDFAEVAYQRNYDDRHVVAAWLHCAAPEEHAGPWMADSHFRETGFPDDIADHDPVWELVDYAFAVCGGPGTHVGDVIDYVAKIGVRGLRIEHWLDQLDTPGATAAPASPTLDMSMLSDSTRRELSAVAAAVIRDLAGRGPRRDDPRVQMLVAEAARTMVARPVDDLQREHTLLAVADGTPLYRLSELLGKSGSTLRKRWDTTRFNRDLAPLAWLHDHVQEWVQACGEAVAEVRGNKEISEARDVWLLSARLDRAADDAAVSWRRLQDTPETVRGLLTAVRNAQEKARRHDSLFRSAGQDEQNDPVAGPALERLAGLLAAYDAAPVPQRRGGAHANRPDRS